MKILQVASECYGLAKTGGLADMVASLSSTLTRLDEQVRVCLPAYRGATEQLRHLSLKGEIRVHGHSFNIVTGKLPEPNLDVVLLDCPELFDRAGDPYRDEAGREFDDNGWRFGCFNKAVVELARRGVGRWQPELVHLHDWHTGLAAALLSHQQPDVASVFTIHNFSFQGVFPRSLFEALQLPEYWWHPDEIEFHHQFSFMKAALTYADLITAVSPRYAEEIRTQEFGCGLEGVVNKYADRLRGIVNGIDENEWNPAADKFLEQQYSVRNLVGGKRANKAALQRQLNLPVSSRPLVIFISRLAHQKGSDLLLAAREAISQLPVQLVVLGRGDPAQEEAFRSWAAAEPDQVAAIIDVNEEMAHRLTGAADLQLMPSRFEPCGLSQMYAQRYGTLPIAHATGGLADTIVDATEATIAEGSATGFLFDTATTAGLVDALRRALRILENKRTATRMRRAAMAKDFSWALSARAYLELYHELIPKGAAPARATLAAVD